MNKKLNVAVVGSTIPPVMGGLEVYTFELARQLAKCGHRVFLIGYGHYHGRSLTPYENIDGVEIFRLPSNEKSVLGNKWLYFQKVAAKLEEINQNFPLSVIHANTVVPAGLGASLFKRRHPQVCLVVTSHGYEVLVRTRNFIFRQLARNVFKRTDYIIGVSDELVNASIKAGADPLKTFNWTNPVDTEKFNPEVSGQAVRAKYSVSPDEILVLSLRRLHPKTGVQYLVQAAPLIARQVAKIKFLIIGEGELKQELIEKVRRSSLKDLFIFTGNIANEAVPKYVAAADLAVFPSLAEATSIACLEVMACGVPVVASDVGGLPEIIEDGYNGLLVPFPKNISHYNDFGLPEGVVEALAEKISGLANDASRRRALGQAAAFKVKSSYGWENYIDRLQKVYERLIDGSDS